MIRREWVPSFMASYYGVGFPGGAGRWEDRSDMASMIEDAAAYMACLEHGDRGERSDAAGQLIVLRKALDDNIKGR